MAPGGRGAENRRTAIRGVLGTSPRIVSEMKERRAHPHANDALVGSASRRKEEAETPGPKLREKARISQGNWNHALEKKPLGWG